MKNLATSALVAGAILFLICALCVLAKAEYLLMWITLLPGLIFGIRFILYAPDGTSSLNNFIMVVLSALIYLGCYCLLDITKENNAYLRLLVLSGIGAFCLKLSYDLLILHTIKVMATFLWPLIIGISAAVPSATCMYYYPFVENKFIYIGIFSIYPLWHYGMGALIMHGVNHSKKSKPFPNIIKNK